MVTITKATFTCVDERRIRFRFLRTDTGKHGYFRGYLDDFGGWKWVATIRRTKGGNWRTTWLKSSSTPSEWWGYSQAFITSVEAVQAVEDQLRGLLTLRDGTG